MGIVLMRKEDTEDELDLVLIRTEGSRKSSRRKAIHMYKLYLCFATPNMAPTHFYFVQPHDGWLLSRGCKSKEIKVQTITM
jgi:hypothetical protein